MKSKSFNLIEIALAIGILVIGLTAIISLFPLGFQGVRDSIGENYSSETADSMLAYIARTAYNDWGTDDTPGVIYNSSEIPTVKPVSALTNTTGWAQLEGDIYNPSADAGVYGLKIIAGDITDFTGEALLWKSNVKGIRAAGEDIADLNYDEAAALHLEVSWPVEKPYAQRAKNTYYFELFNFNQ